jgi:predicted Zn-dependent peptidase
LAAVEILADVIRNSAFTQASVEAERAEVLKELEVISVTIYWAAYDMIYDCS